MQISARCRNILLLIGLLAAIITIGGFTADVLTGWPFRHWLPLWTHKLASLNAAPDFTIEVLDTRRGVALNPPDRFSYRFDVPLNARGTTTLDPAEHVWVVFKDAYGGYYLQNPPVEVKDGKWETYNIRPLAGIRQILWLHVDRNGHEFFSRKAQSGEWGKFTKLPEEARELSYALLK